MLDNLTVQDILKAEQFTISNGEPISGRQYLDNAISALSLNPCDYYTAFRVLVALAKGHDLEVVVKDVQQYWEQFETTYA
jgi:hypothetical protein